jgi:hypothetical protein
MMKQLFIIASLLFAIINSYSQTKEKLDSLIKNTIGNLDKYDCKIYRNEKILNDDAVAYDTAYFYRDKKGMLTYLVWKKRTHTFHITGDVIDITELFFINKKAVYKRSYAYSFLNPQWHKEPDINDTRISMVESVREYYKEDGTALMEYESRNAEGKYSDRFSLLDTMPLKEKLQRRWSSRCDDCIEEEYLSVYRNLVNERPKK